MDFCMHRILCKYFKSSIEPGFCGCGQSQRGKWNKALLPNLKLKLGKLWVIASSCVCQSGAGGAGWSAPHNHRAAPGCKFPWKKKGKELQEWVVMADVSPKAALPKAGARTRWNGVGMSSVLCLGGFQSHDSPK